MDSEQTLFFEATWLLFIVAVAMFVIHIMEKYNVHWFPESGAIILVGVFFGFLGWITGSAEFKATSNFNVNIFNLVFLPAIIFESGYSLKKKGLFRNFRPICLYAFVGTTVSTIITAIGIIFVLTPNGIGELIPIEALMFGALISATDPVATLAIFTNVFSLEENLDDAPTLYNLVFGESVLNDAVAIVLFTSFEGFHKDVDLTGPVIGKIIGYILYTAIGSVAIGVFFGLVSALLTKWTKIRQNSKFDLVLVFMCAYGSYFFASACSLSGLFAIFFCGIIQGHYTWYNLSAFAQLTSHIFFKSIANLCEMLVFLFLGMAMFASKEFQAAWSWEFNLSILLVISIGRIAQIIPLTFLANLGRKRKINWREQIALLYAGLRGSLAFALSLRLAHLELEHADAMISSTLTIGIFTTIFQGTTTRPLLKILGLSAPEVAAAEPELLKAQKASDDNEKPKSKDSFVSKLDSVYFKKWFVANPAISGGGTKRQFAALARGLTQLNYTLRLKSHKQILWDLLLKFQALDGHEKNSARLSIPPLEYTTQTDRKRRSIAHRSSDATSQAPPKQSQIIISIPISEDTKNAFLEQQLTNSRKGSSASAAATAAAGVSGGVDAGETKGSIQGIASVQLSDFPKTTSFAGVPVAPYFSPIVDEDEGEGDGPGIKILGIIQGGENEEEKLNEIMGRQQQQQGQQEQKQQEQVEEVVPTSPTPSSTST